MDVAAIRARMVELSHSGASVVQAVDADLNARALGWLNSAYHELMDEVLPYMPQALQRQVEVLTDADGVAVLPVPAYRVLRAVVRGSGRHLTLSTPLDFLDADPTGMATGEPARILVQGDRVQVWPKAMVTLAVLYIPQVEDLQAEGSEASILLPPVHHHALV